MKYSRLRWENDISLLAGAWKRAKEPGVSKIPV